VADDGHLPVPVADEGLIRHPQAQKCNVIRVVAATGRGGRSRAPHVQALLENQNDQLTNQSCNCWMVRICKNH